MPTCLPSWEELGLFALPRFHWDVTDSNSDPLPCGWLLLWAVVCTQMCEQSPVLVPSAWPQAQPWTASPVHTCWDSWQMHCVLSSVLEITQTGICWLQVLEAAVVNTLSCLGHGGSLGAARWGELVPSLPSGWGPSQVSRPSFPGLVVLQRRLKGPEARRQAFRPWCIFCAEVGPEPAGGAGFPSSAALCSGDAFFRTYCWNWVGCFSLFPKTLLCMNLIISLREFLSSDATGSEGVTGIKALDWGCPVPPYGAQLSSPSPPTAAVPQPCSPRFVSIFADWKAKTGSQRFHLHFWWCELCSLFVLHLSFHFRGPLLRAAPLTYHNSFQVWSLPFKFACWVLPTVLRFVIKSIFLL